MVAPAMMPWAQRAVLFFAGCLWTGSCLKASKPEVNSDPIKGPPHRYLFVAGTLGMGLDFWSTVMRECVNQGVCGTRGSSFHTAIMFEGMNPAELKKEWGKYRPTSKKIIPVNLLSANQDHMPDLFFLHQFSGTALPGNENPNMNLYEQVARYYGDSFKAIVMTRQEKDLLAFYMRMDKKPNKTKAVNLAVEHVNTLASQLRQMPNGTYRCQRFEDLLDLGEHMGPFMKMRNEDGNSFIHFTFKTTMDKNAGCARRKRCPSSPELRAAMDEVVSLCDPADVGQEKMLSMAQIRAQDAFYESKVRWLMS